MKEQTLTFDRGANSLDAVQRAAYRFSDRCSTDVSEKQETILVRLHIPEDDVEPEQLIADFRNEVLDQVLRERIRTETEDVRKLALALAFSKTNLNDAGSDV